MGSYSFAPRPEQQEARGRRSDGAMSNPASWLDRFFQFLAGAEGHLLAGLDLHRFPGLRIATHPRFAPLHLKNSEPDDRSEERRVGKECRSRWSPYH